MEFDWLTGFFLPYINFTIFILLAFKFFRKPIQGIFLKKKEDYDEMLRQANEAREIAERKNRELETRVQGLRLELEQLQERSKNEAEASVAKMLVDAEKLKNHMSAEARRMAAAEVKKAKEQIEEQILSQVKHQVVERLAKQMSEMDQERFQLGAVKQLGKLSLEGR